MPSLILITEGFKRQLFPMGKGLLFIGHSGDSGVPLLNDKTFNNHAAILFGEGSYVLADNGWKTGVFVNSARVAQHVLKARDTIRLGRYLFVVDMEDYGVGETPDAAAVGLTSIENASISWSGQEYGQVVEIHPGATTTMPVTFDTPAGGMGDRPKVMIKGSTLNLTILLSQPIPRIQQPQAAVAKRDEAFFSFVCGCAGIVTLLPAIAAIIVGHRSSVSDKKAGFYRSAGLVLGYGALFLWCIGGTILWIVKSSHEKPPVASSPAATSLTPQSGASIAPLPPPHTASNPTAPPPVANTPPFHTPARPGSTSAINTTLKVPVVADLRDFQSGGGTAWSASPEALGMILPENMDLSKLTPPQSQKLAKQLAKQYRNTWTTGYILYEPSILRLDGDPNRQVLQLVFEDYLTLPTDGKFNTTVVPEKKPVIGHFYIPTLQKNLFHIQKDAPSIGADAVTMSECRWLGVSRGIEWPLKSIALTQKLDEKRLRWFVILKPANQSQPFIIETVERQSEGSRKKTYSFDVFPAEVIAEVLYLTHPDQFLDARVNERVLISDKDRGTRNVITSIESNFDMIMANRPKSSREIPAKFTLLNPNR